MSRIETFAQTLAHKLVDALCRQLHDQPILDEHREDLLRATLDDQKKLRNVRRDPSLALTVHSENVNQWGLREYLVIYGTARITEGGAVDMLQRLAWTCLGPDAVFPGRPNPPPAFITHIRVDRVSGVGAWKT